MEQQFIQPRPLLGIMPDTSFYPKAVFQPLPAPTGKLPYHLNINQVISKQAFDSITSSKKMIFHLTADVGGVQNPQDQVLVSEHMATQFDMTKPELNPLFLYVAGDLVYYYGKLSEYNMQFFEPYKFYPAPIFAIPGNHDGDVDPTDISKPKSLDAFVKMLCATHAVVSPEAGDTIRTTMIQPNVYWTLVTPVANIIGLYTNVPEGGVVMADQQDWFIHELITADKERMDKALIVTLHHPPYSMDAHHGASAKMQKLLDDSFLKANVYPDIIFTGHVHNYQRFTKTIGKRQIPYIVAGAGGYWHLHNINTGGTVIKTPTPSSFQNVVFEKYCENRHGFLQISIDMNRKKLTGEYFTVPRQQESWKNPAVLFDTFKLDLVKNKVK
jgi:acid phosphatase type 7